MSTSVIDVATPATPEAVAAFEQRLGTPLPAEYRAHLLRYNGGRPEPAYFAITWSPRADPEVMDEDLGRVHYFFALGGSVPASELTRNFSTYRDRIPDDTIAIATDQGGNPLLLGVTGASRGRVFFHLWQQGSAEQTGPADTWDNVADVAPSFTAFLDSLRA